MHFKRLLNMYFKTFNKLEKNEKGGIIYERGTNEF